MFQINECGTKIGGFPFVTAPCGIRELLSWSSTRNSKRLVGFSSIGRSRLIGSRATRLSALSSLIRPLFPFLLGDSNDVARPVLDVASVKSYSPLSFQNTGRTSSPSRLWQRGRDSTFYLRLSLREKFTSLSIIESS